MRSATIASQQETSWSHPLTNFSSRRSSECLLFFVISIDNDLITEKQLVSREGVTELLKAQDQMQWVQRMNSIRDWATEIVNNDLIYA